MEKPEILIVDDIYVNQFLLQAALEEAGYKSKAVCNGKIAVEEIINNNYGIVFMDIEMPVMNGIEAVTHIRTKLDDNKNKIPVIALTAHNYYDVSTNISNSGFNEIVYKPYNIEKLIACIKNYTDL